jgi:hypothetical protein
MTQKTLTRHKNKKQKNPQQQNYAPHSKLQTSKKNSQTLPQNHKNTETKTQKQKLPVNSNLDLIRKLLSIQGLSSLPIRQCNPLRNHILWNSQQKSSVNPIQPPSEELKE